MRRTKKSQDRNGNRYKRKHPGLRRVPAGLVMLACILMSLPLTGCGEAAQTGGDEAIGLHEPGADTVTTEPAAVRDLYDAVAYEGAVYPYIEEYSFETSQFLGSYNVLYGDEVQKGDVLFTADMEALDEQIENMQEQLNQLTKEHERYLKKQEEALAVMRGERDQLQEILDNLNSYKPEETILNEEGVEAANPDYESWLKDPNGYQEWFGKYSLKDQDITVGEYELKKKKELYALDYGYYNGILKDLKEERAQGIVTSGISGKVVDYFGYYWDDDNEPAPVPGGQPLIAVGDPERLFLKCSYVNETALEQASDVYALIEGERYEVTYLGSQFRQGTSSSTFSFQDENGKAGMGDYAVLVIVLNSRKHVLTVPAQSVYNEGADRFVHVVEDGITVTRQVETDMSDGVYTEILSGLEEGDQVVAPIQKAGEKTAVLQRTDMRTEYQAAASLYYPVLSWVKNTVKNGRVYSKGMATNNASYVEKGDTVFLVQVEGDDAELTRREREVQRARERLADLEASLDMTSEENRERIADGQESIRKQEEELGKLRSDYAVTEIKAEVSGYIGYFVFSYIGHVIEPGKILGFIQDDSVVYLLVGNSNGNLNYGDLVNITYTDAEEKEHTVQGKIVTVGNLGLSERMSSDYMVVEVPQEMRENMQTTEMRMYATTFRTMAVTGSCKEVPDVVQVPVDAVTIRNGRTYVNVLEEDGTVLPMGFLAGGKSDKYYWVIDGLTEGMKICWE